MHADFLQFQKNFRGFSDSKKMTYTAIPKSGLFFLVCEISGLLFSIFENNPKVHIIFPQNWFCYENASGK